MGRASPQVDGDGLVRVTESIRCPECRRTFTARHPLAVCVECEHCGTLAATAIGRAWGFGERGEMEGE